MKLRLHVVLWRRQMLGVLAAFLLLVGAGGVGALKAQDSVIGPGNIDVGLSGGVSGLAFPYIEPQVVVGILPLDGVTLSVGGLADFGYCVLCHAVDFLTDDYSLRAYYFGAYGRVLAHLNVLAEQLGPSLKLDPYVGVAVGPRFYFVNLDSKSTNDSASGRITSIIFMPHLGTRVFFSDTARFFVFGDLRAMLEAGIQTSSVELDGQKYNVDDEVLGFSLGIALGAGLRL